MSTKQQFFLYCTALAALSFWLINASWNATDNFYVGAYKPMVEKSLRMKEAANRARAGGKYDEPSNEPRAIGLREIEIQKQYGDRYSTY